MKHPPQLKSINFPAAVRTAFLALKNRECSPLQAEQPQMTAHHH